MFTEGSKVLPTYSGRVTRQSENVFMAVPDFGYPAVITPSVPLRHGRTGSRLRVGFR